MHDRPIDYRAKAAEYRARAKAEWRRETDAIPLYIKAIECLSAAPGYKEDDNRQIAANCHNLGDAYFNSGNYIKAAESYYTGTQKLHAIKLIDEDYRKLIELYINLSDAYSHLFNPEASAQAFLYAIQAFNLLQIKTAEEQKIGNAEQNYQAFRAHYEREVSSSSYLASTGFTNFQRLLYTQHDGNRGAAELSGRMESRLAIDPYNPDRVLAELSQLAMPSSGPVAPAPVAFHTMPAPTRVIEDDTYRSTGRNLIELSQRYYNDNLLNETRTSLKQAAEALECINEKTPFDLETIKNIKDNVQLINQQIVAKAEQAREERRQREEAAREQERMERRQREEKREQERIQWQHQQAQQREQERTMLRMENLQLAVYQPSVAGMYGATTSKPQPPRAPSPDNGNDSRNDDMEMQF